MKTTRFETKEGLTRSFFEQRVSDYMTKNVVSVSPDTPLCEANDLFSKHDFNSFPVIQAGKLVGIFSKFDFMRWPDGYFVPA
jgi:CBS domain-containing protein